MSANKTLTKSDIVNTLHDRMMHEVPKSTISAVIDEHNGLALDTLKKGDAYPLGRVGKLEIAESPARKGRNPQTGEAIDIKASKRIKFKTGAVAKRALNGD